MYNSAGTERVLTQKVNYMVEKFGYHITIVTTDQKSRPLFFPLHADVKLIDLGLNYEDDLEENLIKKVYCHFKKNHIYKKCLERLLNEGNYDVCISLCGKEIEFLSSIRTSAYKMAEIHFSKQYIKYFSQGMSTSLFSKLSAYIKTHYLVHNTQRLERLVVLTKKDIKDWQKSNDNVIQIYNSLPFRSCDESNCVNKRMIAAGRLSYQKGFDYLIRAWAIVERYHSDWFLDIYGEGEKKEELLHLINSESLKNVSLRGRTSNIREVYLKSSAFLMTSRYEGLGMVLLEASEYGLPLVSFDCECGPSEVIDDGVNGFLVEMANVQMFADKVITLIEDDNLRCKMGRNAKKLVRRFSEDTIMIQWKNMLEGCLNRADK